MPQATWNLNPDAMIALASASAAINSSLEPDEVLSAIARSAAEVMRAEAASVLMFDRRRNKLQFTAAIGEIGRKLVGKEFDAGLGIAGHVVRNRSTENITDVSRNPDFFRGIDQELRFHTRGLMAAPMIYKSDVLGVVEVLNRTDGGPFPDDERPLLELFANLAACGARNAQTHASLRRERNAFRESVLPADQIIGASKPLMDTLRLAERVAPTHATVLLTGETGTGKEVLAKHIHKTSDRAERAFVAVNCAALPETLLESELFGHEKGSFTGAIGQRVGRFELADEGTLFLDEIGDISPSTQVRLLRILQERAFTRVGGTQTVYCDVRIIAATNRDLIKSIADGKFRDDLFYRLNVFPIPVPSLRERRADIPALAQHFARAAAAELGVAVRNVSPEAEAALTAYAWPGNIRELSNVIERAALLCDGASIMPGHLPSEITTAAGTAPGIPASPLRAAERDMVLRALCDSHWNQSQAARVLGISRDNLRYRVKKYGIRRSGS